VIGRLGWSTRWHGVRPGFALDGFVMPGQGVCVLFTPFLELALLE
jgi:hypothetical protein